MCALLDVVLLVLRFYTYIIVGMAILSWLVAFNVVNPSNQVVSTIGRALHGLTEPLLRPIRRFMPNLGGIDISPLVLLLAVFFVQQIIVRNLYVPSCGF